jgi:hypothetical protein
MDWLQDKFKPDLKWEEARKFDIGLDLKWLKIKSPSADYFIDTR